MMTFEEVYANHYQYVYVVCFSILHNHADAEDATQDAFIRVFRKLHQFASKAKLTSWLYRVAYNTCLMRLRSARGPMRNGGEEVTLEIASQEKHFKFHPALRVDLSRALAQMPLGYKKVLMQHVFKGLEHREIARAAGRSLGTSKSQFFKARSHMRKLLEGYNG